MAQAKGLASLIYHEAALEVRFMRGLVGTTRILTIRGGVAPRRTPCLYWDRSISFIRRRIVAGREILRNYRRINNSPVTRAPGEENREGRSDESPADR